MRAINLILNAKSVEGCKRMLRKQQHEVFLDDATNNREISKQSSSNVWKVVKECWGNNSTKYFSTTRPTTVKFQNNHLQTFVA